MPAKPFPEPTNGKAIARWKEIKHVAVPGASHGVGCDSSGSGEESRNGNGGSPALAGVVQSAMLEALSAARNAKQVKPGGSPVCKATAEGESTQPACGGTKSSSSSSSRRCGGILRKQMREMAVAEEGSSSGIESSAPVMLGDTHRGSGDGDTSIGSKGMRQESYYLRGLIEPEKDKKLLATIASCIPGKDT